MKKILVVTLLILLVLGYGCTQPAQNASNASPNATISPNATANNTPMPGSDRDSHGCIPSAGYMWCDASQKCIRPWEENCSAAAAPEAVKAVSDPRLGTILADGNGMTFYIFTKDSINASSCYGKCAGIWPPFNKTAVVQGLSGTLGTILRSDGTTQETYNGMPLYYYSTDQGAGDVKGQGVLGVWFVVSPEERFFPRAMNASEAAKVADLANCLAVGNLTNVSMYNNVTNTWWINLDTVKSGCSPACVIYANMSADVNWRCTGLAMPAAKPVVKAYQSAQNGEILTDASGMTLYVYANDQLNSPTCIGTCAGNWPPLVLTSGYTTNVSGLPGTVGTVTRSDGLVQVTYNRMPLYTYSYDSKPGDVSGNGVNSVWYVVTTGMTSLPSPPAPVHSYGGGGGY